MNAQEKNTVIAVSAAVLIIGGYLYMKNRNKVATAAASVKAKLTGNVQTLSPADKRAAYIKGLSNDATQLAKTYLSQMSMDPSDSNVEDMTTNYSATELQNKLADLNGYPAA